MNKTIKDLTVGQVNKALLELAEENPDFIYNDEGNGGQCYYHKGVFKGEKCDGCIFGQAFQRLGLTKEYLKNYVSGTIKGIWVEHHQCSPPSYWIDIQFWQDSGKPWGETIDVFKEEFSK